MKVKCPICNNLVTELLSCDNCQAIGCIRCVVKFGKQLLCHNCKSGRVVEGPKGTGETGLFSMFE